MLATYACADAASGVASCAGPVPSGSRLDTSTRGTFVFAVTARDLVGNQRTVQRWVPASSNRNSTPPQVRISTPAFRRAVRARAAGARDYACRDRAVGVATCTGSVADGARLPTASPNWLQHGLADRAQQPHGPSIDVVVAALPRIRPGPAPRAAS